MSKVIVGMFDDIQHARETVNDLVSHGFRRDDISLIASDEQGQFRKELGTGKGEDVKDGAASGAGIGAVLGGLGGLLVGLGLLAIPGFGPILAAGPIATTLAGAGAGAVTGGIVGALVDLGIPEENARVYEQGLRNGAVLVAVNTADNMVRQAMDIFGHHNPIDVDQRQRQWQSGTRRETRREDASARQESGEVTMPVIEEELRVGKRQVEEGGVRMHSRMEEKPVEEEVTLREEHVNVERHPVDRPVDPSELDKFREGTMEMKETREEAVTDKRARVVEEVTMSKDVEEHPETVRDTVRRTDVEVEDTGRSDQTGFTDFSDNEDFFRDHFNSNYKNTSYTYEQYRPYYEYGYGLTDQYRDRDWKQVEPMARREWENSHPNSAWDEVKDAIYQGWMAAHRGM